MTYANPFLRVAVIGTMYGEEEWTYTFSIDGAAQPETVPAGLISAVEAFHKTTGLISQNAKLTTVKVNEINEQGHYASQSTTYHDWVTPVPGTGGLNATPPQVACAVTLRTALRRGPGANGRFYLPLPALSLDANGQMAAATAQAYADAAGTMLNGVATALGGRLVVASQGTSPLRKTPATTIIPPAHVPVTRVEVGRVYDTQRRRRSDLLEAYALSGTFAPPP